MGHKAPRYKATNDIVACDDVKFAYVSPVPQPSTWAMMILGFAAIGFMAYRRNKMALTAV
jgi:hypothetical protein